MSIPNIRDTGITEIYRPIAAEPLVDVVLVHGLNGHPYHTWTTREEPKIFWPLQLLPQELEKQHCRILVYGYDANVTALQDSVSKDHIHNHAETFAQRLAANRKREGKERPIIFVCHSLGGLVVKRMLIYGSGVRNPSHHNVRSIYVSTHGIIFLGTPHRGSDLARWGKMLQSICHAVLPKKILETSSHLVAALETNSETLQVINRDFVNIKDRLSLYCFHETKSTDLKGTRQIIVEEDSAYPGWENTLHSGIDKDHSNMCKFESEYASGFPELTYNLSEFAEEAVERIRRNWISENRDSQNRREDQARQILGVSDARGYGSHEDGSQVSGGKSMENSMVTLKSIQAPPSKQPNEMLMVTPGSFRPNSVFVGFQIQLDNMHRLLTDEVKSELGTIAILLWGPTGCGKTHLARQYVWNHRHENTEGTFWVDCTSKEDMLSCFLAIGVSLGCIEEQDRDVSALLPDSPVIHAIEQCLKRRHGWMLVFDHIRLPDDDAIRQFAKFLPNSKGNKIIFVSPDKHLSYNELLFEPKPVKVPRLGSKDAMQLLYLKLEISKPTTLERKKARALVNTCKCLPFALHTAAHYLLARGQALSSFNPLLFRYNDDLSKPILGLVKILEDESLNEALALLTLLSLIYYRIPVAMLVYGAKFMAENEHPIESSNVDVGSRYNLENTIKTLVQLGLVEMALSSTKRRSNHQWSPVIPQKSPVDSQKSQISRASTQSWTSLNSTTRATTKSSKSASSENSLLCLDMIEIHKVIQKVIWARLKDDAENYWKWVAFACHFLQASYTQAKRKNTHVLGSWLPSDFEQFQTQGQTLHWHFTDSAKQQAWLVRARSGLRTLLRDLDEDRKAQAAQYATSDATQHRVFRSIFEASSSFSDESPDSARVDLSRKATWGFDGPAQAFDSPIDFNNHRLEMPQRTTGESVVLAEDYLGDHEDAAGGERMSRSKVRGSLTKLIPPAWRNRSQSRSKTTPTDNDTLQLDGSSDEHHHDERSLQNDSELAKQIPTVDIGGGRTINPSTATPSSPSSPPMSKFPWPLWKVTSASASPKPGGQVQQDNTPFLPLESNNGKAPRYFPIPRPLTVSSPRPPLSDRSTNLPLNQFTTVPGEHRIAAQSNLNSGLGIHLFDRPPNAVEMPSPPQRYALPMTENIHNRRHSFSRFLQKFHRENTNDLLSTKNVDRPSSAAMSRSTSKESARSIMSVPSMRGSSSPSPNFEFSRIFSTQHGKK